MSLLTRSILSLVLFCVPAAVFAQPAPEFSTPVKEHEWLKRFEGEWESTSSAEFAPNQPPIMGTCQVSYRMLGGFWVISETEGEMQGTKFSAIQTIGYDPARKKYVGTWVDTMMNHLWKYEGFVDESGKKLVLEAEGPDMTTPGKTALYRDTYEFKSADHIQAQSLMQGPDGKWITFMTGQVKRKSIETKKR